MRWTDEKKDYLEDSYGTVDMSNLAKTLGTTELAVKRKAHILGFGSALQNSTFMTAKELARALKIDYHTVVKYIEKHGLFATRKKIAGTKSFWRISIDNFWNWSKNCEEVDFTRLELGELGKEPKWVADRRKSRKATKRNTRWNDYDDNRLKVLWNTTMTIQQVADKLERTYSGIRRRAGRLKLKPKKIEIIWSDVEVNMLLNMLNKKMNDKDIAWELGREESQVKSKKKMIMRKKKLMEGIWLNTKKNK